jgi:hypothetical protein
VGCVVLGRVFLWFLGFSLSVLFQYYSSLKDPCQWFCFHPSAVLKNGSWKSHWHVHQNIHTFSSVQFTLHRFLKNTVNFSFSHTITRWCHKLYNSSRFTTQNVYIIRVSRLLTIVTGFLTHIFLLGSRLFSKDFGHRSTLSEQKNNIPHLARTATEMEWHKLTWC